VRLPRIGPRTIRKLVVHVGFAIPCWLAGSFALDADPGHTWVCNPLNHLWLLLGTLSLSAAIWCAAELAE